MKVQAISNNKNHQQTFESAKTKFNDEARVIIDRKFSPKKKQILEQLIKDADQKTQYVTEIQIKYDKLLGGFITLYDLKSGGTRIDVRKKWFQSLMSYIKKSFNTALELDNWIINKKNETTPFAPNNN